MTTINIYPECPKPEWMQYGAWCYCHGEGYDKFIVVGVGKNAAMLANDNPKRTAHGWESFSKLHRNGPTTDEVPSYKKPNMGNRPKRKKR